MTLEEYKSAVFECCGCKVKKPLSEACGKRWFHSPGSPYTSEYSEYICSECETPTKEKNTIFSKEKKIIVSSYLLSKEDLLRMVTNEKDGIITFEGLLLEGESFNLWKKKAIFKDCKLIRCQFGRVRKDIAEYRFENCDIYVSKFENLRDTSSNRRLAIFRNCNLDQTIFYSQMAWIEELFEDCRIGRRKHTCIIRPVEKPVEEWEWQGRALN